MRKSSFKHILLALVLILTSVSCQATSKEILKADSCWSKAIGDSISEIIVKSKHTKTFLCKYEKGKSIRTDFKKLRRKYQFLLRFLLSNPQMTQQDNIVYGHFTPCIGFELKKSNKEKVYVYVDLGLGKWSINDTESKQIKRFDIEGYELLRFCAMLYPTDKFITGAYNNRLNK